MSENKPNVENVLARLQNPGVQVQPFKVQHQETFRLTAGELRGVCSQNPKHPKAQVLTDATKGMPDEHSVVCDRVDLEAVIGNYDVVEDHESGQTEDGPVTVVRKRLGGPRPRR